MSLVDGVRRIAVLRANALGDFVFALPALEALDAAYPDAHLTLVGQSWHRDLLESRPGPVDEVVEVVGADRPPTAETRDAPWLAATDDERATFVRQMRAREFDVAIQLHGGGGNSNPLVAAFGARVAVGARAPEAKRLDRTIPYVYYQQEVARCLEVVGLVGARPRTLSPNLHVTDHDRELAARQVNADEPYVVLHVGATDGRRRWPPERFALVADALAGRGFRIVLTGTSDEAPSTAEVIRRMRCEALDLAGRTSLAALVGVLAGAELLVSNDTGPMHVGIAVGTPTVGIYWVGNLINGGPLTRARHRPVLSWRRACPTCGTDCVTDVCSHHDSFVDEVGVDEVLAAADSLLDERQQSST